MRPLRLLPWALVTAACGETAVAPGTPSGPALASGAPETFPVGRRFCATVLEIGPDFQRCEMNGVMDRTYRVDPETVDARVAPDAGLRATRSHRSPPLTPRA